MSNHKYNLNLHILLQMSLSKRVNVFLERARQIQTASPKLQMSSRSPVKSNQHSKPASPTLPTRQEKIEKDLLENLESMVETFLKTRNETSKRLEIHKQKESKFIEEIKKSLELEIEKKKSLGLAELEKEYKEKTDKVLKIVRQEALNIDRKLVEIQSENLKLKQKLSEKNIEVIDMKILKEISSVGQVLERLLSEEHEKNYFKLDQLLELNGNVFDGSLDEDIARIVGDEFGLMAHIAAEIEARSNEWRDKLSRLESEIELRRKKYKKLDKKLKQGPRLTKKKESFGDEEEFFGHRETRSDTFGCIPVQPKKLPEKNSEISAEEILANIYSEILRTIDN